MELEIFRAKFERLFQNRLSFQEGRSFLKEVYKGGVDGRILGIGAKIMRKYARPFPASSQLKGQLMDVVGTGGDRKGTFNISTTTALLLAGLGIKVAKHGNRSVTSKSGSADMLEKLGIHLNLSPEKGVKMVQEVNFTFLFAPNYHPAMEWIMPIRKSLSHPTIFNLLGPLANPASPGYYLLGVYHSDLIEPMGIGLQVAGVKRGLVVASRDGLDEISIASPTDGVLITEKGLKTIVIDPKKLGMEGSFSNLKGEDGEKNAKTARAILTGEEKGDKLKGVLLNGGVALWVRGVVQSIEEGIEMAWEGIRSGQVGVQLEKIIAYSQQG